MSKTVKLDSVETANGWNTLTGEFNIVSTTVGNHMILVEDEYTGEYFVIQLSASQLANLSYQLKNTSDIPVIK